VVLDLQHNPLGGTLSPVWALPSALQELYISYAQLGGPLESLRPPPRLVILELGYNSLTGTFPAALTRLANMQSMDLQANLLTGQLPASFAFNASRPLAALNVASNKFTGEPD